MAVQLVVARPRSKGVALSIRRSVANILTVNTVVA
jgi:hypothetical protein